MTSLKYLWPNLPQLKKWQANKLNCALFTDIDGTLCHIKDDPSSVTIPLGIKKSLANLAKKMPLVAVITGRSTEQAKMLLGLQDIYYLGSYGEDLISPQKRHSLKETVAKVKSVLAKAVADLDGISLEEKGLLLTVHWRHCQQEHDVELLKKKLITLAKKVGLKFDEGKKIFELRPFELNKEVAIVKLAKIYGLKKIIFIGDDLADAQAFAYLKKLRQQNLIDCLTIGVLSADTPDLLMSSCDYQVNSYKDVKRLFDWLAA